MMKKRLYAIWTALLLLLCCALPVGAVSSFDADMKSSLSVGADWEKKPLQGAQVTLHRVASITYDFGVPTFDLCGPFAKYPVKLLGLDNDGWKAAAETLSVYAEADQILPDATALVTEDATASFSDMESGLYLMQMLPYTDEEGYSYYAMPVLLELPEYDEIQNGWTSQAKAKLKLERQAPSTGTETESTQLTVQKVWNNGAMTQPQSIRVALVCDGVQQQTVELSNENNWRYTFSGLDAKKTWNIVEVNVPDGYTVTYSAGHDLITVTNTGKTAVETTVSTHMSGMIPQTGVLWWPVPVLALMGLLLFALGWRLHWGNHDER